MLSVEHGSFGKSLFFFPHCFCISIISICFLNALLACPVVSNFASLEDCIRSYWFIGYKYASIVMFLSLYHGIHKIVRQLKYLISIKYNLRRKNNKSATHKIRQAVSYKLNGTGYLMDYGSVTRCLRCFFFSGHTG